MSNDWIEIRHSPEYQIETIQAHFEGHAYDPHWHDSYLVGVTRQGTQQFNCRRNKITSTPGDIFLLEPGEIHDGDAPIEGGFTYQTFYLSPAWLDREIRHLFHHTPSSYQLSFAKTIHSDPRLAQSIAQTFQLLHFGEFRMVQQSALDNLLAQLAPHIQWRAESASANPAMSCAHLAREYIHSHANEDLSLQDLAAVTQTDRFTLTRAFKRAFGMAPHAYLVQLRLAEARILLSQGQSRCRSPLTSVLPIRAILAAGFAARIASHRRNIAISAQIFQTEPAALLTISLYSLNGVKLKCPCNLLKTLNRWQKTHRQLRCQSGWLLC